VLVRILAPKREGQEEVGNSAPDKLSMTKPKRRRWEGHEAPWERSNTHVILVEKLFRNQNSLGRRDFSLLQSIRTGSEVLPHASSVVKNKGNVHPRTGHEDPWRGVEI
jgi:hypothetical protein